MKQGKSWTKILFFTAASVSMVAVVFLISLIIDTDQFSRSASQPGFMFRWGLWAVSVALIFKIAVWSTRIIPRLQKATVIVVILATVFAIPTGVAFAEYCWQYVDIELALNPKSWECSEDPPSGADKDDPFTQKLIDQHYNWHCINGPISPAPGMGTGLGFFDTGYGLAFLADHKQLIWDFDLYREEMLGLDRMETWDPNDWPQKNADGSINSNYNPMPWGIPGSAVSAEDAGAIGGGSCIDGPGRSGNGVDSDTFVACPTCVILPNQFRETSVGGSLETSFATADDLGIALDAGTGWHGSFHSGISSSFDGDGNNCWDMNPPRTAPRDAMFWRAHDALDDVHSAWLRTQAADLMIVLDRSGSMSDLEPDTGKSKLEAAKSAATMFSSLVGNGSGHALGVVTFSSSVSSPLDLPLTTGVPLAPEMEAALSGVNPSGATAIGPALLAAQDELVDNGFNNRKAILLLTDGKENVGPCLDGDTAANCSGSGNEVGEFAFGDTQICVVGYGNETNLDSIILRNVAERQGGIFTSGSGELELKKFFLDCFADIFNFTTAVDPIDVLPADKKSSSPVIYSSSMDKELMFVLAWQNPEETLSMEVISPSGAVVDLSDPKIERSSGTTWESARIVLPYGGEKQGDWQVRALRNRPGKENQKYFINILAVGAGRLDAVNLRSAHYTDEPLFPALRIKESYRPLGEFDDVKVSVSVTRPNVGMGNLLRELGDKLSLAKRLTTELAGDPVDPRTLALRTLNSPPYDQLHVRRETMTYGLGDDGQNGDKFANNHYWTAKIDGGAITEGIYQLHFVAEITHDGQTFRREANQSIVVAVKIDSEATKIEVDTLKPSQQDGNLTRITFVPQDGLGNYLGPDRWDAFELSLTEKAIIRNRQQDGKGKYSVDIGWNGLAPNLGLSQDGRLRFAVDLSSGVVTRGSDLKPEHKLHGLPVNAGGLNVDQSAVSGQRTVSNQSPGPGETISVVVQATGFDTYHYFVEESFGGLEFVNEHDAYKYENPGRFTQKLPVPFTYILKVPDNAQPGSSYVISGEMWSNPEHKITIAEAIVEVAQTETDQPTQMKVEAVVAPATTTPNIQGATTQESSSQDSAAIGCDVGTGGRAGFGILGLLTLPILMAGVRFGGRFVRKDIDVL